MKKTTVILYFSSFILCIIALIALKQYNFKPPRISTKLFHDLGRRENGDQVIHSFNVSNDGDSELILYNFQSSCSCSGLFYEDDIGKHYAKELSIAPHQSIQLYCHITVHGQGGTQLRTASQFQSNDPSNHDIRIDFYIPYIYSGLTTIPDILHFGQIEINSDFIAKLNVIDSSAEKKEVSEIQISDPKRIKATFSKNDILSSDIIGLLNIIIDTSYPGDIDESIRIFTVDDSRKFYDLKIKGIIKNTIAISPSKIYLPIVTDTGLSYKARVMCSAIGNKEISIRKVICPDCFTSEVFANDSNPSAKFVQITYHPKNGFELDRNMPSKVTIVTQSNGRDFSLDVLVFLAP